MTKGFVVSFRASPEEKLYIESLASENGQDMSTFIRSKILDEEIEPSEKPLDKHDKRIMKMLLELYTFLGIWCDHKGEIDLLEKNRQQAKTWLEKNDYV